MALAAAPAWASVQVRSGVEGRYPHRVYSTQASAGVDLHNINFRMNKVKAYRVRSITARGSQKERVNFVILSMQRAEAGMIDGYFVRAASYSEHSARG
jgi:hypothetical protein